MALTSRERVRLALAHEEPDRVPVDFGATRTSGIAAVAYRRGIAGAPEPADLLAHVKAAMYEPRYATYVA